MSFSSPPSANHSLLVPLIPDSGDFCEVEIKLPVEIASHVSSGELDIPSVSDTTCVFGVFHPTAKVVMEIPSLPIDGVDSITFTNDEDQATNPAATNAILPGIIDAEDTQRSDLWCSGGSHPHSLTSPHSLCSIIVTHQ